MAQLKILILSGNTFSTLPDYATYSSGSLTRFKLVDFECVSCGLTGPLPVSYSYSASLEYFRFDNNKIEGTLPSSYSSLVNLKYFTLSNNLLYGTSNKLY